MSSDKSKRQQRRNVDSLTVVRQRKLCLLHNANITVPLGRFRKHHALNCGRSHCFLCVNPRRLWGRVTIPELRANEAYRYELLHV